MLDYWSSLFLGWCATVPSAEMQFTHTDVCARCDTEIVCYCFNTLFSGVKNLHWSLCSSSARFNRERQTAWLFPRAAVCWSARFQCEEWWAAALISAAVTNRVDVGRPTNNHNQLRTITSLSALRIIHITLFGWQQAFPKTTGIFYHLCAPTASLQHM